METPTQPTWTLRRNGIVIAEMLSFEQNMFWLSATIKRLPGFEEVRAFFEADLDFLNNPSPSAHDIAVWEALSDEFDAKTSLFKPNGTPVADFLMHIDGDEATWRWTDEPFD